VDDIAKLRARDRADVLAVAAVQLKESLDVSPLILEKDYWVCWTLKRVFGLQGLPGLLFKGGTSLSKGYGLINRFSEDIDLVLDRKWFGVPDPRDPDLGSNEIKRRREKLTEVCNAYIRDDLLPTIRQVFRDSLGAKGWSAEIDTQQQDCIVFSYPPALDRGDYGAQGYIKPAIKLEFGIRGEHNPAEMKNVRPYIASIALGNLAIGSTEVNVLHPRRTFWEKALIHHRHVLKPPENYHRHSRHSYDLVRLAESWVGQEAMADTALLAEVVDHERTMFLRAGHSIYDAAVPGTFRLVSDDDAQLERMRMDYRDMEPMFFVDPPPFDQIIAGLRDLQARINAL